jgi:hypothetical protein
VLSLVWYPPELIRSPYASDVSVDQIRAPHSTPLSGSDPKLSARPTAIYEQTDPTPPQPNNPYSFYHQDPYPRSTTRPTGASSSTVHSPSSSGRRTPAKLRRRRRPGSKTSLPRTPPTSYTALSRKHSRVSRNESAESVAGSSVAPGSSAPSQSLDTLLNSAWPEPPIDQSAPVGEEQEQSYNYLSETGAEDDSDQEEYLASPTSIGGASTRPTTPKHSRSRSRSRSPGDAIREQHVLPPVIHTVLGDQPDWEPESRVTSYLSASPTTRSHPTSPAVKSPPVPPLPPHVTLRARQNLRGTSRPVGIIGTLPFRSDSPNGRSTSVTPTPPPRSLSATPPARPTTRAASPSPTRASAPTPRAPIASPQPRVPSTAPILRSLSLPRRTTSYQSAASVLQSSSRYDSAEEHYPARRSLAERRPSLDDKRSSLEDRRSIATPIYSKHRSSAQPRKDPHSPSKRDSGQSRRSRKDSNRSHKGSIRSRDSLRSHRDSIALRKDSLQAQRRDSVQSHRESLRSGRQGSISSHKDQNITDNQIWTVPRNYRQRPTISFEFPPTNEFWRFLSEYQKFCNSSAGNPEDSGYGTIRNEMSERRTGSAASGSTSKSSRSKADPVKDWHKTQSSSSRVSYDNNFRNFSMA